MRRKSNAVYIDRILINSKAYAALSGTAVKVLILFLERRQIVRIGRKGKEKIHIVNNGEIIFTYREAKEKYGIGNSTFARAIDDLIEKGFLEISHHGAGLNKDSSKYSLSDRWQDYGTDKFQKKSREKDSRGMGFTSKKKSKKKSKSIKHSIQNGCYTAIKTGAESDSATHSQHSKRVLKNRLKAVQMSIN